MGDGDVYYSTFSWFVLHALLVGFGRLRQRQVRAQALLLHSPVGRRRRGSAPRQGRRREEGRAVRGLVLSLHDEGTLPTFCRVVSPLPRRRPKRGPLTRLRLK